MNKPITPNRFLIQPSSERPQGIAPYIPRPARQGNEIKRRKSKRRGTLILEQQHQGMAIVALGTLETDGNKEAAEWAAYGATACLGSGPYMFNGDVMHRYVSLPMLAAEDIADRPSSDELRETAYLKLAEAAELAGKTVIAHEQRVSKKIFTRLAMRTGKTSVEAALMLACVPLGNITSDPGSYLSNQDVQLMVRQTCMSALQATESLAIELGTYPSVAQLSDPLSPLAVALQTEGSNEAVKIYEKFI